MKLAMLICCSVVLAPAVGWFALGGTVAPSGGAMMVFLPVAGCLVLHGTMFFFMGRSRHSAGNDATTGNAPKVVRVPAIGQPIQSLHNAFERRE